MDILVTEHGHTPVSAKFTVSVCNNLVVEQRIMYGETKYIRLNIYIFSKFSLTKLFTLNDE